MERPGSWGQGRGTAPDRSRQNGHSTAASNTDVAAPRQREPSSTARPSEALSCGLSMLYAGGSDTACRCKHPATTPSTSAAMIATPISARVSRKCPPTAPGQVLGTAADPSQHDGQLTTGRCPPGPSRRHRGQDEAAPSGAPDNSGPTAREPDAGCGREAKRPAPGARRSNLRGPDSHGERVVAATVRPVHLQWARQLVWLAPATRRGRSSRCVGRARWRRGHRVPRLCREASRGGGGGERRALRRGAAPGARVVPRGGRVQRLPEETAARVTRETW